MKQFEYEITRYPSEDFNRLVFFCSEAGKCHLDQVPHDQIEILEGILNERGSNGWELIQLSFGKDGIIAFWKRRLEK